MSRPPGLMVHFHTLWRWAFGRSTERTPVSTVDSKHTITPAGTMEDTLAWLEGRGYRTAVAQPVCVPLDIPGEDGQRFFGGSKLIGKPGVLYGRRNEPLFLAQVGDVLVWDGTCVKVEE